MVDVQVVTVPPPVVITQVLERGLNCMLFGVRVENDMISPRVRNPLWSERLWDGPIAGGRMLPGSEPGRCTVHEAPGQGLVTR